MHRPPIALVAVALAWGLLAQSTPSRAQESELLGKWETALGVVRISQEGKKISGKLVWTNQTCPFAKNEEVLKGVLLEDSLAGQWRYCLKGSGCASGEHWAPTVMLVARGGKVLSGAAHFQPQSCSVGGKGKGDGVVLRKLKPQAGKGKKTAKAAVIDDEGKPMEQEIKAPDPKEYEKNQTSWDEQMQEGAGQMDAGQFERARKNFKKATELNPSRPEAFNGIGVTYYARSDYEEALNWYKKSLEVDPNFGDGYYNMACIYSLMKKNEMGLRYLEIALLNGYKEGDALANDTDLNNLREDPRFQEIIAKLKSAPPK